MSTIAELDYYFDYTALYKLYESFESRGNQIHISSIDGKTYELEDGNLYDLGLDQNDFTTVNSFFKGTYVEEVYNTLDDIYGICRGRYMRLTPANRAYSYHRDTTARLHIPLTTNELCFFYTDGKLERMPELGRLYCLDTTKYHSALNLSWEKRVHMVFCLRG